MLLTTLQKIKNLTHWNDINKLKDVLFDLLRNSSGGSQNLQQTLGNGNTAKNSITLTDVLEDKIIQLFPGNAIALTDIEENNFIGFGFNNGDVSLDLIKDGNISKVFTNPISNTINNFYLPICPNANFKTLAALDDIKPNYITKTKSEIDSLIAAGLLDPANGLTPGSMYRITEVHPNLYNDFSSIGTIIYLQALTPTTLAKEGHGEFWNPKYNQAVAGFEVWRSDIAVPTIGSKIIWGGYSWTSVNGTIGNSVNILSLDSAWSRDAYSAVNYNKVIDVIEYDYSNDWISRRYNIESGNDVTYTIEDYYYMGYIYSAISVFMFGNNYSSALDRGVGNIKVHHGYNENINFTGNKQVELIFDIHSYQDSVTFSLGCVQNRMHFKINSRQVNSSLGINSLQQNLTFEIDSFQEVITLGNSAQQVDITFANNSYQSAITFANNSFQGNIMFNTNSYQSNVNLLSNSRQQELTFMIGSYQKNTTIPAASQMKYLIFEPSVTLDTIDYTTATLVFGNFPKTVYKRPDGVHKIRYYNNSDVRVTADVTD